MKATIPRLAGSDRTYAREEQFAEIDRLPAAERPEVESVDEFAALIKVGGYRFLVVLGELVGVENCQLETIVDAAKSRYPSIQSGSSSDHLQLIPRPLPGLIGFCGLARTEKRSLACVHGWLVNTDYINITPGLQSQFDHACEPDYHYHTHTGFVFLA